MGLLNKKFEIIRKVPLSKTFTVVQNDFDSDGKNEILASDPENEILHIFREGLYQPVSVWKLWNNYTEYIINTIMKK